MLSHEKARTLFVLREMAKGRTIDIGGRTFLLSEDLSICVLVTSHNTKTGDSKEKALPADITLSAFHTIII